MRIIIASFIFMLSIVNPALALTYESLPDTLSIIERPDCLGCADVKSNDQIIGSLFPESPKFNKGATTFEFVDEHEQKLAKVKFKKTYWGSLEFELFDANDKLVGHFHQLLHKGNPVRFEIFAPDGNTILAVGSKNIFSTQLTIYLKDSWDKMMSLSKPFFSWHRDWNTTMINKSLLAKSDIDANVFAAVLAMQSLTKSPVFVSSVQNHSQLKETVPPAIKASLDKLELVGKQQGLEDTQNTLPKEMLDTAAKTLDEQYQQTHVDTNLTEEQKITQFVDFSIGLLESNSLDNNQKQAIFQFLTSRLKTEIK